jgi:hypothetical protein
LNREPDGKHQRKSDEEDQPFGPPSLPEMARARDGPCRGAQQHKRAGLRLLPRARTSRLGASRHSGLVYPSLMTTQAAPAPSITPVIARTSFDGA